MNAEEKTQKLLVEDGKLVDLVAAALVDPNLHTDMRMRIAHEITELLRATHNDAVTTAKCDFGFWARVQAVGHPERGGRVGARVRW